MESMSWSDETRCLHCDGKLPLYRKLTSGQFCSAAHGKAYWKEQERLAVERLHQTHDSLRAYRPAGALEAILGVNPESNVYYTDGEVRQSAIVPDSIQVFAQDHAEDLPARTPFSPSTLVPRDSARPVEAPSWTRRQPAPSGSTDRRSRAWALAVGQWPSALWPAQQVHGQVTACIRDS